MIDEQRTEFEQRENRDVAVVARESREERERITPPVAEEKSKCAAAWAGRQLLPRLFVHASMLDVQEMRCKGGNFRKCQASPARKAQMRNTAGFTSTTILEKPSEVSRANAAAGATGTNVLLMWAKRLNQLSPISS